MEPGLAFVVDGGGGTNLMSGGDRSPPLVVLSPRFSATTCTASTIRIAGIALADSDRQLLKQKKTSKHAVTTEKLSEKKHMRIKADAL